MFLKSGLEASAAEDRFEFDSFFKDEVGGS